MRALALCAAAFVLMSLESPLLRHADLWPYAPDLALMAALYAAMHLGLVEGAVCAALIGLLRDGFSMNSPLGMHSEILGIIFFLARPASARFDFRRPVPLMALGALSSVLASLLFLLFSTIFDQTFERHSLVFRLMWAESLITAPFAPLLFAIFGRLDGLLRRRARPGVFFEP